MEYPLISATITDVVYLGKGYFQWDTARLKNELAKRRDEVEDEEE